ncbi:hypothetical protein [Flavisolibacter tropicus]|uniref:EamA domain-containing protein n=1 Tax=Flavisolibacter tropicus TaxID=1492898 RepID=A0A172TR67_9BACT|nr:hypothetical protein [Flavisolibacter tropicus]ANE49253.1 hypothetical protein SY85_00770 [Flavisolibacter tropicus]
MIQAIVYISLYAILNVSGSAIIKWQLKGRVLQGLNDWIQFLWNPSFMAAFVMILASALVLFKALSFNNFSLIIPVATGLNFLLTVLVGYFLFQDKLSYLSFIGFLFIISGVIILSLNNQRHA